ncbi:MAG: heat shock protein HspQ, partial [Thermodesulfobacteriota bacterium]
MLKTKYVNLNYMTEEKTAKFTIGQIVQHLKFDYRGVIIDIDPVFSGTDEWYESVAKSRPPKDMPWYHVIVEGSDIQTYVAERHLENDSSNKPVNHPLIDFIFSEFENGRYKLKE